MGRPVTCLLALLMVLPMASLGYSSTQLTVDGAAWFDCDDSWVRIENSTGNEIVNDSDFTIQLTNENHTFYMPEIGKCQGVIPVTEEMPNLRPAPSDTFFTIGSQVCPQDGMYLSCEGQYTTGDLINDSSDVFAINVSSGHTLALTLVATSAGLDVEIHFQNTTNEIKLEQEFMLPLNSSIGSNNVQYIPITDEGRIIVSVSSPSQNTVWSIRSEIFETSIVHPLIHLDNILGIGPSPFAYPLGADESLVVTKSSTADGQNTIPLMYRYVYSEPAHSEWINATLGDRISGIDDLAYIEFQWDCNCQWLASMSRFRHFDAGWGMDAPSLRPLTPASDNSTHPLIVMDGHSETGELTLHMNDYQDILRVETTGWNESIHLVDVIVEGDILDLEVTVWNIDQKTWDVIDEATSTYSMNKISVSLNVDRGTHFIRIQHINGSASLNEGSDSVQWQIRVTTAVLDEGEEPWFPASESVKEAASIFYWLIGLILILPFIIFYWSVKKEQRFAQEFASRKNRLEWLSSKLDKGEFMPRELSRALRAVSSLEWDEALKVWGEPRVRHLTLGIDMAVWTLDESLAENGEWPLLIGLRSQDAEWSAAALRFEAPEGKLWAVKSVEPRLLTREYEIFLDTIHKNSRFFVQVTLEGHGDALDIHLSGMTGGEPIAAKPAKTIYRSEKMSEE